LISLRRRDGLPAAQPVPHVDHGQRDRRAAGAQIAHRRELKEIARRRLTEVGLWEAVAGRLDDSPFRLSGGRQQLLCLAISPQVLLDEPTSSLDPVATEAIETLIRALVPSLTIVIVTHNLAQARRVSDRTMFVYQGHLAEPGDTAQVFENPAQQETAHYVAGRYG
jgi:phosphate transport system ATP-binding protein